MNTFTIDIPTSEWVEIHRDGEYVAAMPRTSLLPWFHAHHSFSMDHALTFEGYSLHMVEERYAVYGGYRGEPVNFHRAFNTHKSAHRSLNILFNKLSRAEDKGGRIAEAEFRLERLINGEWQEV